MRNKELVHCSWMFWGNKTGKHRMADPFFASNTMQLKKVLSFLASCFKIHNGEKGTVISVEKGQDEKNVLNRPCYTVL